MRSWGTQRDVPFPSVSVLFGVVAAVVGAGVWLHAIWPPGQVGYDFASYATAAQTVARGENPYHRLALEYGAASSPGGVSANGYVYPPLLALLLSIPVRLGADARGLWLLWNLATFLAALWMGYELNRGLRGSRDWHGTLGFFAACLVPAVAIYDLSLGQADLLVAALAVGAFGLWLRKSPWAGVALGLAIAIKPSLALLVLVWLWYRDWRTVLACAATATAALLLPFVAAGGIAALGDYVTFFLRWNAFHGNAEYINQAPYGMLLRVLTPNAYTQPLVVAPWLVDPLRYAVAIGAVGLWLASVPRPRGEDAPLTFGACLLALPLILLVSPLSEDIHFCLLIPALVGFGWLALACGWWRRPAGITVLVLYALCCLPRMQELIYPDHLLVLPGQTNAQIGSLVVLLRSGILLYIAVGALVASSALLRANRHRPARQQDATPSPAYEPARAT